MLLGSSNFRPMWVVVASVFCACALNIFPLGWLWGYFQPDWLALVIIYWCLWEPERMGAGLGFLGGLLLDVLDYTVMGKNMLAKTVLGFLSNKISLRLRTYPIWQQCFGVAVLVFIDVTLVSIVQYFLGQSLPGIGRLLSPLSSMLMWPIVVMVLQGTQRKRGYLR